MIALTTLAGMPFILNSNLIETVETIPETKVTLTSGKYFLVVDSKEEVVSKVIAYNRKLFKHAVCLTPEDVQEESPEQTQE